VPSGPIAQSHTGRRFDSHEENTVLAWAPEAAKTMAMAVIINIVKPTITTWMISS
jgi:hypothetical protein